MTTTILKCISTSWWSRLNFGYKYNAQASRYWCQWSEAGPPWSAFCWTVWARSQWRPAARPGCTPPPPTRTSRRNLAQPQSKIRPANDLFWKHKITSDITAMLTDVTSQWQHTVIRTNAARNHSRINIVCCDMLFVLNIERWCYRVACILMMPCLTQAKCKHGRVAVALLSHTCQSGPSPLPSLAVSPAAVPSAPASRGDPAERSASHRCSTARGVRSSLHSLQCMNEHCSFRSILTLTL